jgi:hypothetical protein
MTGSSSPPLAITTVGWPGLQVHKLVLDGGLLRHQPPTGIVKLVGASRELDELVGAKAGLGYAAALMPQTSCHALKAQVRSAR